MEANFNRDDIIRSIELGYKWVDNEETQAMAEVLTALKVQLVLVNTNPKYDVFPDNFPSTDSSCVVIALAYLNAGGPSSRLDSGHYRPICLKTGGTLSHVR